MPPILLWILGGTAVYFAYENWFKAKGPTADQQAAARPGWLPPIPALSKTYNDYKTIQLTPDDFGDIGYFVAWNLTTNQPQSIAPGASITGSQQENIDMAQALIATPWGQSFASVPGANIGGTIFWMNVNGQANRLYTPLVL